MRATRLPLDVLLALELAPSVERSRWSGQGALPLSVRIAEKLSEMLIAGAELKTDLQSEEAGQLRVIAPMVDDLVAQIEALLARYAA